MKSGDPRGVVYRKHTDGKLIAISFVTVGELWFGAYRRKWGASKINNLKQRLRAAVIVPYDYKICETYATLKSRLESEGLGITGRDNDLWIAACAVRHSIPLISNNRKHFEDIPDLVLISEAPAAHLSIAQGELFEESEKEQPASGTANAPSDTEPLS